MCPKYLAFSIFKWLEKLHKSTLKFDHYEFFSEDAFMHISFAEFGFGFLPSIMYGKFESLCYNIISL